MNFVVADTFTDRLAKLDKQSRWLASGALMEFRTNPKGKGLSVHRLDGVKDKNFWSARVNDDVRLIYWQKDDLLVMCYVDHHDAAYRWASRRRLEVNKVTKAIEFVLTEERVQEVITKIHTSDTSAFPLFGAIPEALLRACGVTDEWMEAVKTVDHETFASTLMTAMPDSVSENLFRLATGQEPRLLPQRGAKDTDAALELPETRRHLWKVTDEDMLARALTLPWEKWAIYLHPSQSEVLDRRAGGPMRVTGGPGTGKSVLAVHRVAKYLSEEPDAKILLTTFSRTLAQKLRESLAFLIGHESPDWARLTVTHTHAVTDKLLKELTGKRPKLLTDSMVRAHLQAIIEWQAYRDFPLEFVVEEWRAVVDAEQIQTFDEYQTIRRTGRGVALQATQRLRLWNLFEELSQVIDSKGQMSTSRMSREVATALPSHPELTFDHVVVDEVQDYYQWQLRLLKELAGPNESLFMTGDMGQRIYSARTSFLANGIDIRGRSYRLSVNYRTTSDILAFVEHLMPSSLVDPDLATPEPRDTVSLMRGEKPETYVASNAFDEVERVSRWLRDRLSEGYEPTQLAVFARTRWLLKRVAKAIREANATPLSLEWEKESAEPGIAYGTMHRAKGLEFRAVVLMGCSSDIIPSEKVLASRHDEQSREDFLEQERNLFYVACSRAREKLLISGVGKLTSLLP